MVFATSAWHVISASIVLLVGMVIALAAGRKFGMTTPGRVLFLYVWHSVFCVLYANVVLESGGDALDYYQLSLDPNPEFSVGTESVSYFAHLFSSMLGFSFLGVSFVFNIFGALGLLAFDSALRSVVDGNGVRVRWLSTLIVLLPSVSFWSAAIGKDSIAFMAAGLALWASLSMPRRFGVMVLAATSMFVVRPHMAGLLIVAIAASQIISSRISLAWRLGLAAVALGSAAIVVPFALDYAGLGDAGTASDIGQYIESRQSYNREGGGGINIAELSLPMQLFAFLFRPLPFEAVNGFALAASVENAILLALFAAGAWGMLRKGGGHALPNRAFLWIYCCSAWLLLAMVTANLGISLRQKWMFLPMLLCILICYVGKARSR